MNYRQALALAGVTILAFVFNCSEFTPVGLLTDIGSSFGTSEAETGLIVSVYAWAVMLLSVPLMIIGTRLSYRPLFLTVTAVFFIGQVLTTLAVNYWMMMAARLVVACAHCIFWAAGAPLAVRLVDESKRSLALSIFEIGAAAALVLGMPLGRAIGLMIGWRMTFGLIAVLAAILLVYTFFTLPNVESAKAYKFSQFPTLFKNRGLVAIFILTALFAWGYYTGYSYIEPYLLQVAKMDKATITLALSIFGLAGVCACLSASKFYPRFRSTSIALATIGVPIASLIVALCAHFEQPTIIMIACIIWGLSGSSVAVIYQGEIINFSDAEEETVAMAFFSGIYNFGIGFGAFLGGRVVESIGIAYVFSAGSILGFIAALFCLLVAIRTIKTYRVKL